MPQSSFFFFHIRVKSASRLAPHLTLFSDDDDGTAGGRRGPQASDVNGSRREASRASRKEGREKSCEAPDAPSTRLNVASALYPTTSAGTSKGTFKDLCLWLG